MRNQTKKLKFTKFSDARVLLFLLLPLTPPVKHKDFHFSDAVGSPSSETLTTSFLSHLPLMALSSSSDLKTSPPTDASSDFNIRARLIDHGFDPFHPWFIGVFTTNYYIIESIYYIYKIRSALEISDDFGAFWRYLEQAPEMTIELDHRSNRLMFKSEHRLTAKRTESPFGHSRLEAQVFTNLQDYP
ncbi:hypothetical protein F2Q68_00039783 [Brassica cretica]|uniref:Uncharacterized protein n=1 Tax=Brassica cretica TaxID=69181 RepID=A0A8S9MIB7_BRACR|nr:hypothetical protein F2Q68_00039783 [Brassica cretica]